MFPGTKPLDPTKIIDLPKEIIAATQKEVEHFNDFSLSYIMNHAKLDKRDIIAKFEKGEIKIINGIEKYNDDHAVNTRLRILALSLEDLKEEYRALIEQMNFAIPVCLSDKSDTPLSHIPKLAFSKESYSNNILIPSINNLIGFREYDFVDHQDRPIFHKHGKLCFAGSLTNIYWNEYGIEYNMRLKFAEFAAAYPDIAFCKILRPPKFDIEEWDEVTEKVKEKFPAVYENKDIFSYVEDKVSLDEQLRYKYQVCIDGHTSAWARLPWQMRSNSVVFKLKNPQFDNVEWFYKFLINGHHLYEVNIGDVKELYDHLQNDPQEQLRISSNARAFADQYIDPKVANKVLLLTLLLLNQKQTLKEEE